jgi:L-2,4-diaminobutyrate decarboxylase
MNIDKSIVSPAQLGIVNFRYIANGTLSENDLNKINQKISREITESGFAQIFTTELRGKKVLRMCTIHPETTEKDIYDTIEKLMESAICKTSSNPPPRWESESQLRNYA